MTNVQDVAIIYLIRSGSKLSNISLKSWENSFENDRVKGVRQVKENQQNLEKVARTRLSKNFILRDFLYSTSSEVLGVSNTPDDPEMVIRAGKALCVKVLEPLLFEFGHLAITYGYQCRACADRAVSPAQLKSHPNVSNPHQWDRGTFGCEVYARVDVLPMCVEDGQVPKDQYGRWIMHNLDVDLLMQWTRSNVFCITIGPRPRRVWFEWGDASFGERRQRTLMGADYWQRVYPALPLTEQPKFGPSHTGGARNWRNTWPPS